MTLGAVAFSDAIALVALVVSLVAAATAYAVGYRQAWTAHRANQLSALLDAFREHRSDRVAGARAYVCGSDFPDPSELAQGLDSLPPDQQASVRDLMWHYDNLGALVAHEIVDVEPVAGYLGGSVLVCWERLEPLVNAERERRREFPDKSRWQEYFENLAQLVSDLGPERARRGLPRWRI